MSSTRLGVVAILGGVVLVGLTTIAKLTAAAPTAAVPSREQQWVDVGETADGKATLQVDKKSIRIAVGESLDKSLVGGHVRFIPNKTPVDPKDKQLFSVINGVVTNAQACKQGQGRVLIGPIDNPSESSHRNWSRDSRTVVDILAISLCSLAVEQIEQRKQIDSKQYLKTV